MCVKQFRYLFFHLVVFHALISCGTCSSKNTIDSKVLSIGEELWRESLPLGLGSRLYQLQGLKSRTWYEVKISYPASIPASFSLELKQEKLGSGLHKSRRLLNTEKIIFKTESSQDEMYVLVTVEPEGFVAIPNVSEREFIHYDIVFDELVLGIPHKAWGVVVLAMLCLGIAFIVASFIQPCSMQKSHSSQSFGQSGSKDS